MELFKSILFIYLFNIISNSASSETDQISFEFDYEKLNEALHKAEAQVANITLGSPNLNVQAEGETAEADRGLFGTSQQSCTSIFVNQASSITTFSTAITEKTASLLKTILCLFKHTFQAVFNNIKTVIIATFEKITSCSHMSCFTECIGSASKGFCEATGGQEVLAAYNTAIQYSGKTGSFLMQSIMSLLTNTLSSFKGYFTCTVGSFNFIKIPKVFSAYKKKSAKLN